MPETPKWKEEFPIAWTDDHFVTRRAFTRQLVLVSCASFAATAALAARQMTRAQGPFPAAPVALLSEIPTGSARVFAYPTPEDPCLLVRTADDNFVAYSQKCTHLGCPVLYEARERVLHCPCHAGYFDVETGKVLAGPPPRPLPRITLERRGDELWATGVEA